MKRIRSLLFFSITLLISPSVAHSQGWSGIINPRRAMDWTQAGIPGGIPSATWTQCGSTIAAYSGSASKINSALAACGANQFVLLGPGTFNLSSGIDFSHNSKVVLRGSGASSTFLVFNGSSSPVGCNGQSGFICILGPDGSYPGQPPSNIYTWSAGYAQGSNQITLSSTANITTISGGSPTLLMLNQDDDGYTGFPASGSAVDNGGYFVCADEYETSPSITGCSADGPDGNLGTTLGHRWQYEVAVATAVNSGTGVVTISPPLKHPNWRSGQSPKVWLMQTMQSSGVENLSMDQGSGSATNGITIWGCYQCWISGVRMFNFTHVGFGIFSSSHLQIQNNYIQGATGPDPYGMDPNLCSDNLIVNNIIQNVKVPILRDGPDTGTVIAYNFAVYDNDQGDGLFGGFWDHSAGDDFNLFEGNISPAIEIENSHGGHLNETSFRNFSLGWESCANSNCGGGGNTKGFGTSAIMYQYDARYGNVIANVSGTPGFHTSYISSTWGANAVVYNFGAGNGAVSPNLPPDPLARSTALLWGNWDTVTNETRFCGNSSNTGWSTACASTSEVPIGAPSYPNSVPTVGDTLAGQSAFPASFYYSSKPSWFGSTPWPPIGPDVTGGNVGQCTGELNVAGHYSGMPATSSSQCQGTSLTTPSWGGHVNAIPAMNCALNVMGMHPDGTGGVLSFDANTCYGGGSSGSQLPTPPTNLLVVVN